MLRALLFGALILGVVSGIRSEGAHLSAFVAAVEITIAAALLVVVVDRIGFGGRLWRADRERARRRAERKSMRSSNSK